MVVVGVVEQCFYRPAFGRTQQLLLPQFQQVGSALLIPRRRPLKALLIQRETIFSGLPFSPSPPSLLFSLQRGPSKERKKRE